MSWNRRPLSVVVLGNSMPLMQVPSRPTRADGNYPELLADRLWGAGIPTEMHNQSRWFGLAHTSARTYRDQIIPLAPDVLIVHTGVNEMMPWLLPVSIVKHLMARNQELTRTAKFYRRRIADPAWSLVKAYRIWASAKVGTKTWQLTPRRFRASIELILRMAAASSRPLVLVVDINPPGDIMRRYLPGVDERYEIYQQLISDIVRDAHDPGVRIVRVSKITESMGVDSTLPDGIHWTAAGHAAVAEALADEVLSWLSASPQQ